MVYSQKKSSEPLSSQINTCGAIASDDWLHFNTARKRSENVTVREK